MPEIQNDIVQVKKENKESARTKVSEESIETKIYKKDENKESIKIKISEKPTEKKMKILQLGMVKMSLRK